MLSKISLSFLATFISMNALALPILTESEDGSGVAVTIHPDHENPSKVYFFPNRGEILKDSTSQPQFALTYWGLDKDSSEAGAYMSGVFKLSVDSGLQKSINDQISKGKEVAVIPVKESYVDFKMKNGALTMQKLFEEVDLADHAGRPEDPFSMSALLTKAGAKVFVAQLRSSGFGGELNYCYNITGLSPIFDAKITLNYKKVYEHFLAQARIGRWWWKTNIRLEVEKLVENSSIKININGGSAQKYDYIMALVDRMTEKFFVPELENRRNSAGGRLGISYTVITEDREQTFHLTQRELIHRDFCVAVGMSELKNFPHLIVNADQI